MPRKPDGKERKERKSIRIEPAKEERLKHVYGSLQKFFDTMLMAVLPDKKE